MTGSRSAPMVTASRPAFFSCLQSVTANTCNNLTSRRFTARRCFFAASIVARCEDGNVEPDDREANCLSVRPVRPVRPVHPVRLGVQTRRVHRVSRGSAGLGLDEVTHRSIIGKLKWVGQPVCPADAYRPGTSVAVRASGRHGKDRSGSGLGRASTCEAP